MRKSLWIIFAIMVLAVGAPAAIADSFTYTFVGTGYFAGTDVSFTTSGPAVEGTKYSPNPGSTDEFVTNGGPTVDEGAVQYIQWDPSLFAFFPCTSVCTIEMFLVTSLDATDGPTFAGTSIPGVGTDGEFFGHGTLTVTETPEPPSFALLLSGFVLLGLVLAMRKRLGLSLPQSN